MSTFRCSSCVAPRSLLPRLTHLVAEVSSSASNTILPRLTQVLFFPVTARGGGAIKMDGLAKFVVAVFFFHSSEYILANFIHGKSNVNFTSLLISKQYVLAMLGALLEYVVELFLFPEIKEQWIVSNVGLMMVVTGEVIRKVAILTAQRAFTHNIKIYHEEHHKLVTSGIYRFMRHPGYCGFFIWAIGTQLMLCNPVCIFIFALVTWRFFSTRILYEEFFLRQFFGSHYEEYAANVPSGLPFIK